MNFKFTTQGKRLQATLQAGQKLILTKAEGGETFSASPEALLSVQGKKLTLQVEQAVIEDSTAIIKLTLTNLEIQTRYRLRQIGIYAKTDSVEEVLYIVGQDEQGEEVPAITEKEVEYDYSLQISFDNAYEISCCSAGNDFAKKTYVKELLQKKVDAELHKHASDQNNPHNVTKQQLGLDKVDNTSDEEKEVTISPSETLIVSSAEDLLNDFMWDKKNKISKFFQGIRDGLRYFIQWRNVAHNLVTNNSSAVLAADQGKILKDEINLINQKAVQKVIYTTAQMIPPHTAIFLNACRGGTVVHCDFLITFVGTVSDFSEQRIIRGLPRPSRDGIFAGFGLTDHGSPLLFRVYDNGNVAMVTRKTGMISPVNIIGSLMYIAY